MAEDASTLLVSIAAELSLAIYGALDKRRLKPSDLGGFIAAHDVAVRLHLINTYLSTLPPYWIDSDVEQLCRTILKDAADITRPMKGLTSPSLLPSFTYFRSSSERDNPTDPETCLVTFFKVHTEYALSFKSTCDDLLTRLTKEENDAEELPYAAIRHLDSPDTPIDFGDGIFKAVQSITECDPSLHETTDAVAAGKRDAKVLRHTARLRLHEVADSHNKASRSIGMVVSALNMALWQEFCLRTQSVSPIETTRQPLGRGGFCQFLEEDITSRLFLSFQHDYGLFLLNKSQVPEQILESGPGEPLSSVLHNYDLTPKDKVMLSYAVARSYWQYYDSELMRTKWTSDSIWFMPEKYNESRRESKLPLCAYLSFPFGATSDRTPDILYDDLLNHRCPRVFDIGVLLLEIGLAKPFRRGNRRGVVAQTNLNHKIATDELRELERTEWGGFNNNKVYFERAIRFCLQSENFIPVEKELKTQKGVTSSTTPANPTDVQAGVIARRRIFHKNVVLPLAWLAKRGFKAQAGDITYVNKKPSPAVQRVPLDIFSQPEPEALFHSAIVSELWLRDLKMISQQVERKRRECRVTAPVRVAILDTGLDRNFPTFKTKSGLEKTIIDEMDFTTNTGSNMTDTFGHGTFMARLIMECAPGIEIMVARVAMNTNELKKSEENIEKAILWAGQPGKADIISMSFGLPTDDERIRDAIDTVQKNRKEDIIFLASAGNSSTDNESFPARHPSVISVYATNCHGSFLQSNSTSIANGAAVLGTYGDDIPDDIRNEFSTTYPNICKPGSSVATAIMAGISATMLAYGTALPLLVPLQGLAASTSNHVLQRLWTTKGMEAVLYRLAQKNMDNPRLNAVKPMWFWKSRPNDTVRYCALCDTLSDIDRRYPRLTGMR